MANEKGRQGNVPAVDVDIDSKPQRQTVGGKVVKTSLNWPTREHATKGKTVKGVGGKQTIGNADLTS